MSVDLFDPKEIGKKIKNRRKELGYEAEEVAILAGMDRATYYRIEAGSGKTINTEKLRAVAKVLGVEPSAFVAFETSTKESGDNSYTQVFRENLELAIMSADRADVEDGNINIDFAQRIIEGTVPLSFEYACELAEQFGISLDEVMERKNPALMSESEVEQEIIRRLSILSAENLQAVAKYVRFLSESE